MACPYARKICHKDNNFFPYARMCGNIKKRGRNGRSLFYFSQRYHKNSLAQKDKTAAFSRAFI